MFGSQKKWAKFLSANLPKVDETSQSEEEKEELLVTEVYCLFMSSRSFEWLT